MVINRSGIMLGLAKKSILESVYSKLPMELLQLLQVRLRSFKSVFTTEDLNSLPSLPDSKYPSMQEIRVTEPGVYNALSQLYPHKAGGPDNIPARVLKELTYDLTPMLSNG